MNWKKNWKTTIGGVVAVLLMAAGIFWPDQIDVDSRLAIETAISEILTGAGGLVAALTLVFAKDSD